MMCSPPQPSSVSEFRSICVADYEITTFRCFIFCMLKTVFVDIGECFWGGCEVMFEVESRSGEVPLCGYIIR